MLRSPLPRRRPARLRRWFGWTRDTPVITIELDDDEVRLLCVRRGSAVSASGRASLAPGTVRNGRLRTTDPAIEGLRALATHLRLPADGVLVQLVEPATVEVVGGSVIGVVEADEIALRHQLARAAGFADHTIEPVPAALDRVASRVGGDRPHYGDGGGWRWYRDGDHLEIEPSDRGAGPSAGLLVGPTPVERAPLTEADLLVGDGSAPITVDPGVRLLDRWPVLLGGALAVGHGARPARVEELVPVASGGWTMERVTDLAVGGRS